ncbi:MAG: hypothetical protein ACREBF_01150 [Candidatus Micrarchaeales archaeon]
MEEEEPNSEIIHLIRRSQNINPQERIKAAKDPKLPEEFLKKLKFDPDETVREVAKRIVEKRFPDKTKA